ncbi:MAG TPA: response regulator transcription factor [Dehalococcoidia bacterium]|nr:response regulator transcription factor [Dehalococcoidia bacterium]
MARRKIRVLVVEDEAPVLHFVRTHLANQGFEVATATDGADAIHAAEQLAPHLVILDLMLPKVDGWEVCRRIREESTVPVIVLSALGGEAEKVRALDLGADDYITKPFSLEELLARVRAVLRRTGAEYPKVGQPPLQIGEVYIDFDQRAVSVGGAAVRLTPTEFALLRELAVNAGKVLPHRMLLQNVWGPEYLTETEYLRVFIRRLRSKIEQDPNRPRYILTEPRSGYRFVAPERGPSPKAP